MKNIRRFLSVLICLVMVLLAVPFSSNAASPVTMGTASKNGDTLYTLIDSGGTLHKDVTVKSGTNVTKYEWKLMTPGDRNGWVTVKTLVSDTKPVDYVVSTTENNTEGTKYYAYYVYYDSTFYYEIVTVNTVESLTFGSAMGSMSGFGYDWDKTTQTMNIKNLGILDAKTRYSSAFHFVGISPVINFSNASLVFSKRNPAFIYFENPSNNYVNQKMSLVSPNTANAVIVNYNGSAIHAAANRGTADIEMKGDMTLGFASYSGSAFTGNDMTTCTVGKGVSFSAQSSDENTSAISKIKMAFNGSKEIKSPKDTVLENGVIKYKNSSKVVNSVEIIDALAYPTITKATTGTIYVPTNSTYTAEVAATLPAGEGPVKYWWAYDMHGDLSTWSLMDSLSENGGKRTFKFGNNETVSSYRCEVWNNTNSSASVITDPVTFVVVKNPFTDVKANQWYTSGVLFCNKNGYITGMGDNFFNLSGTLTRAQFVQILAKVDGVNLDAVKYSGKFTDVKDGIWYAKAVQWAVDCGVTGGTGDNKFSPNNAVSREQLATFFMAYAKYKGYNTGATTSLAKYTDAGTIATWAKEAVNWAIAEGLISGTSDTTISPKTSATRAQAAVIFKNFVENYVAKQKK